ncbi:unnamed protein product [Somion occarium]|uniref:MYND-type domain-containing protein n=1 Tax=Somion occarium TaxID=3059160 RepID=A0ABP1E2P2_9APHY
MSCNVCSKNGTFTCSVCKITRYCSHECQRADWMNHKIECKENLVNVINVMANLRQPTGRGTGSATECSGCSRRFDASDSRQGQVCKDCGYRACESCSVHHSRGTCRCYKANFGQPYCTMEPRTYQGSKSSMYRGDRHPKGVYPEDAYESKSRVCQNCGQAKKMVKKEYLYPGFDFSKKSPSRLPLLGICVMVLIVWYFFV